jgi:protein-L-isoaspartate(D-aspartate) O-methyltransferase
MRSVPRHAFVPADHRDEAYADTPLPIGYGQTISQPYIVAEMTRQLKLKPTSKVLEVGTGSGYQAAVLTEFTPFVTTIEIIEPLAAAARRRLTRLGYDVVAVRHGDGYYGWEEKAPFDGIIVTCATGQIPPPLLRQLAPGGRMIVPVGAAFATQSLMLVEKDAEGTVRSRSLMAVRFVPLVRKDVSE